MLRAGILYRIGHALDFISAHPLSEQQFLNSFGQWDGVSGKTIISTSKRFGWITQQPSGDITITASGQALCDASQPIARLRSQLEQIISSLRPAWAALATRGRNAVASYAPHDAVQCLTEAGLLDQTDAQTVEWWDRLARDYRSVRDDDRTETGRLGERCTFEYERQRTGAQPVWVALDSNDAGYDIISRVGPEDA